MKINDALNLVLPVRDGPSGTEVMAFHAPISREVFEAHYKLLAYTKANLAAEGIYYQMDSGPRIAAMVLRDKAKHDAELQGDMDDGGKPAARAADALFQELKRLTTILGPTENGWQTLPVDAAIQAGLVDREEWDETLSAIVFFTCHYALARAAERQGIGQATASVLKASVTSSPLSEYVSSLPKSTTPAASTAKAASSVPS